MGVSFEWDDAKAQANQQKHGVTLHEAATIFANPLAAIFADPDHSQDEDREIIVGHSDRNRVLLVSSPSAARQCESSALGLPRHVSARTTRTILGEDKGHER